VAADRQRGATPCHNKPDNALPQAYYDELFKRGVDCRSRPLVSESNVTVTCRELAKAHLPLSRSSDKCSVINLALGG
jgi:hypothetical protein